jgi:hypothetical protein
MAAFFLGKCTRNSDKTNPLPLDPTTAARIL